MHPPRKKEVRRAACAVGPGKGLWPQEHRAVRPNFAAWSWRSIRRHSASTTRVQELASSDGQPLNWFAIAGLDGKFYPAVAEIKGETVVASSPQVSKPRTVRFAWGEGAMPNFFNKEGLPAVPFRTDNPFGIGAISWIPARSTP